MRTGPYTKHIFDSLTRLLKSRDIPFQEFSDQELLDVLFIAWKEENISNTPGTQQGNLQFDPAFLFLDFTESDFLQNKQLLENMGIYAPQSEEPSLESQDFICPKCRYNTIESGLCPKDKTILIPWNEYRKIQKANEANTGSSTATEDTTMMNLLDRTLRGKID